MICSVSFVLVLGLVVDVQAQTQHWWTDDGPDHLWSTPANWDTGTVPTSADNVRIKVLPGPIIANPGAFGGTSLIMGVQGGEGAMTVDGGTLTIDGYTAIGQSGGIHGTFNMISGTVNTSSVIILGNGNNSSGTLNMIGGTINTMSTLRVAAKTNSTGHVNLDGGIITADILAMRPAAGAVGTMDVRAGTLILNGDQVSPTQSFIDAGWITAYDGQGTLQLDYDVTNKGKTTLNATHNLRPNPADGSTVAPGEMELSWTLPDPCVPGQPVSVDVYFTDNWEALYSFTDPAAIQVVNKQNVTSVVVQTQLKTRYYWAVDTYIGDPNDPVFGPIFSFYADKFPPEVDAGADVVTWLEDGVSTGNLDATVIDNEACSVQWTVVSEPNDPNSPDATITDPSAEDTSITLSALGEYVLQLEAFDGEYTSSDTVTINVYNDGCEAAQSLPDYVTFPGDVNGDCIFDQLDLDILNEDWLKDNSLAEEWFKLE